jgi:hypothetical protein
MSDKKENVITLVTPPPSEDQDALDLLGAVTSYLEDENISPKDCIIIIPNYDTEKRIFMISTMKIKKDIKWELDILSANLLNNRA